MVKLRVGVLEIINDSTAHGFLARLYESRFRKIYASITPQAVSVWCRQLGHHVRYATYYGQAVPESLLPDDLDVVFIATDTRSSALAYALAKLYRRRRVLTVIGGAHARAFPLDCLRFFDFTVRDCDKVLIDDILKGVYARGSIVTSGRALTEIPSVEERMPEIVSATFTKRGKPGWIGTVGILSSIGCPYKCDFCIDWASPYVMLPRELLEADLRFVSERWPGLLVGYHDPNFGVRFDEVLDVIESLPMGRRNRYAMESSLAILRGPRLSRLRETKCVFAAPGVESWSDYSNKAGVGKKSGWEKLERVVDHFHELHVHIPGLQANFMFGTDVDAGDEPVELTKEFIRRTPFVWPTINIPVPFGGTPLHEAQLAAGRILKSMPFSFYYLPFLVTTLKNYHPIEYYEKLIEIHVEAITTGMLLRRLATSPTAGARAHHTLRTLGMRNDLRELRAILARLRSDPELLAYHEGRGNGLPAFYRQIYARKLGRYCELLSEDERRPVLDSLPPASTAGIRERPASPSGVVAIKGRRQQSQQRAQAAAPSS
jgi:radical SAM superfamily enzyme YgiQ (UPF0313 family)